MTFVLLVMLITFLKMKLVLAILQNVNQTALIYMCLMKYRIPGSENVLSCSDGIPLKINVTGTPIDSVYIPYPEPGEWFLGLYSQCFNKHTG